VKFMGIPVKYDQAIPDGYAVLRGRRDSGPGTTDPMEEYGVVIRPDGVLVSYVIRDGRVIVT
jgi:hypothetical protein